MNTIQAGLAALVLAATSNVFAADKPADKAAAAPAKPYTVVDGNKVDDATLKGWKTWRAQACERCHGAQQEGGVGPALTASLKTLTKDEFKTTMMAGRLERGMPNFSGAPAVVENLDGLYAYLMGRANGDIKAGRLEALAK